MAEPPQPICRVATARMDYQGHAGQCVLNRTIKSGTGLGAVFAPTWDLVIQWKRHQIPWDVYQQRYLELMRTRFAQHPDAFVEALSSDELVLCCYCQDTHATTRQCHRYILVEILAKVAAQHGIGFEYIGEVSSRQR